MVRVVFTKPQAETAEHPLSRAEILHDLAIESATAGRMLWVDRQGRPNPEWQEAHERMNDLLDQLEACDA